MTTFAFNPNHAAEENILRLEEKFFELDRMIQRGKKIQRSIAEAVAKVTAAPQLSKRERIDALADLANRTMDINQRVRLLKKKADHLDQMIQALHEISEEV